jgi:hypothetical protein
MWSGLMDVSCLGSMSKFFTIGLRYSHTEGGSGNEDDPDGEIFHGDAPYV